MANNTGKKKKYVEPAPSLEALIGAIDRRIDQVPNPIVAEGFEAFLGNAKPNPKNERRQYIRFRLNHNTFALPLQNTFEIDYLVSVTPLPNLPQWILGICHLRGEIISVVDIKQVMQMVSSPTDSTKKLVMVRHEGVHTAIVVDKIEGILKVDPADKRLQKPSRKEALSGFVQHVVLTDLQKVHLLDVAAIMRAIRL